MRIILNRIDSSVSDPTFIREHCYHPRDFSRQRSLTFKRMVLFFLSGAVPSLQFGIDKLFRDLGEEASVTKQAVSKACQKFPYEALVSLQQQAVNTFHAVQTPRRWMGYRLVAVDGTKIRLPLNDDLADEFGTQGNQTKTRRPMALLVSHQDVLTRVPLSCELSPVYMGERFLAERLLSGLRTDDLAIYDRGFPSFALFAAHRHAQVAFCARLTLNFTTQVTQFVASGETETVILWTPSATMRSDCAALEVCDQPLTLRLIRVDLGQGHIEILATSLLDTQTHPAHLFKSLYAERWGVEESYKAFKTWLQVERFRTHSRLGVYQEIYARFLTLTLAAISAALSQPVATSRTTGRSREYRINFRATLLKFRDRFFSLWSADNSEKSILDLFQWIIQDQEMIRPGRSNPRKSRYINPLPGVMA
ncbi:IS4 family transposase [Ectothiorhodospira lacustris]|uniref:IS4 family transposase n=1 Tax=Ectothiorhodospira lacustris TaxID=2899127 RepID=UPI001EE7F6BA|nr:IS4 family transposase [Ectothiorhodospira lacustris]MCG5502261.1 IS4 family transposase [Ectothiorhodospira lacustris]